MKKIGIIGMGVLALSAWLLVSNKDNQIAIIKHIEAGDAEQLATYFGDDITLFLPNELALDNAEDAKEELANFFEQNPPVKFTLKHSGDSKGHSSHYFIGMLKTKNEALFRLTVVIAKDKIESFTIDPEEIVGLL